MVILNYYVRLQMKPDSRKFSGNYKAGMLVVFYVIHCFAFQFLLASPNDLLSKHSFEAQKGHPDKSLDCLLLLAKKAPAVQSVLIKFQAADSSVAESRVFSSAKDLRKTDCGPTSLSGQCYKRYRLLRVLLV
jgi:hypothetical protein